MGEVVMKYTSKYDRGDFVVFARGTTLEVGVVETYYIDGGCFWYNIRVNPQAVYTYSNGDIAEYDIFCKLTLEQVDTVKWFIVGDGDG